MQRYQQACAICMMCVVLVTQSCLTLCDPTVDCSPPGSSIHAILQARKLEWVATPFSRGSSQPRGQIQVCCITDRFFTICAIREALADDIVAKMLQWKDVHYIMEKQ